MFRRCLMCAMTMLLIAGVWGSALAQTPEELIAIRGAFDAALNAHDLDQMMTYWTDDAVWDVPAVPPASEGKEAVRTGFEEDVFQGLPDFQTTEGLVLASGNIVVVEHLFTGTHQGEWLGIPATGQSLQIPHMDIYEFEGDKIKKLTTYMDNVTVMVQLGLMPAGELPPLVPSFTLPDPEPTGLSPVEVLAEFNVRFNAHDLSLLAKLVHPNADLLMAPLGTPLDRDTYIAALEQYVLGWPDIQKETVRVVDMGEGWVMSEAVFTGTHNGPFFGIPATGSPGTTRAAMLDRFDADGLMTADHVYYDNLTVLVQIGAVPAPGTVVLPTTWGQIKSLFQE